jgi:hypothetical protein
MRLLLIFGCDRIAWNWIAKPPDTAPGSRVQSQSIRLHERCCAPEAFLDCMWVNTLSVLASWQFTRDNLVVKKVKLPGVIPSVARLSAAADPQLCALTLR